MSNELAKKLSISIGVKPGDKNALASLKREVTSPVALHQESVVLCCDISGSMYPHIGGLQEAVRGFIGGCTGASHVGIILWADMAHPICKITPALPIAFESTKKISVNHPEFERWIGGTTISCGLEAGIESLDKHPAKVNRIVLMTDGCDGRFHGRPVQIAHQIKGKIIIDCVAFGEGADMGLLEELAQITGGVVKKAGDVKALVKEFKMLTASVRGLLGAVK